MVDKEKSVKGLPHVHKNSRVHEYHAEAMFVIPD